MMNMNQITSPHHAVIFVLKINDSVVETFTRREQAVQACLANKRSTLWVVVPDWRVVETGAERWFATDEKRKSPKHSLRASQRIRGKASRYHRFVVPTGQAIENRIM